MHPIPALHVQALVLLLASGPAAARYAEDAESILPSVGARVTVDAPERSNEVPRDAELVAAGARVGRILIDPREIFDTTSKEEDTRFFRLANRLHMRTLPETVASQLLFASGEPYSPRLLQESARVLRTTRYLREASIFPVAWHDGLVDVQVVTQDVWTLSPGFSFGRTGGRNTTGIEIEELNLLGRGSQITLKQKSEVDRDVRQFTFRDSQIGRSWWHIDAGLADNSDGHRYAITLERPFHALDARRAMGGWYVDDERIDAYYDLGEVVGNYRLKKQAFSVFGGYSAGLHDGETWRFTGGFTRDANRFSTTPSALSVTAAPADRVLAWPWVGVEWLEDRYRTTRNRDQIARTEDYPLGWHGGLQVGVADAAFGADRSAWILSGSLRRGVRHGERHTWQLETRFDGRLESGEWANAVLAGSMRYYFRQSPRRLFYAAVEFEAGSALDADHQILLGGDNGLRGYPLRYQGGSGRWLVTLEQRLYSDWYPFRLVNVGGAAFIDVGRTQGNNVHGTPSQGILRDVGVGLRLGNSRSALGNVIHVDLALPLDGVGKARGLQIQVETKRSF